MGPVSFESLTIEGGREQALAAAARLSEAGIRVMAVNTETDGGGPPRHLLVLRSAQIDRARRILGDGGGEASA